MKITFPILTLSKGGAQRMLVEITNGLTRLGHDVTILLPSSGALEFDLESKLIRTEPFVIKEQDYPDSDVIVSNFFSTVAAAQAASIQGKGLHVRFPLCYEPPFLADNHLSFPSYHVTDKVIVISNWQRQLLKLIYGIDGKIVPVGVSPSFYNMNIRDAQPTPIKISAIFRVEEGGFSFHREQEYLAATLSAIQASAANVQIQMICTPTEFKNSPYLQRLQQKYGFQLCTPEDDRELNFYYNQSHIFVSSSTYDTAGLPELEAMRCGNAVVSIYSGGNMDYCKPGENALVSYRHQNRLTEDILRLVKDEPLRNRLAKAGQLEASSWIWEKSISSFEAALYHFLSQET